MRGILFDLDGTLLDIDLSDFFARYFKALTGLMRTLEPTLPAPALGDALQRATDAMTREHEGIPNRDVFDTAFLALTGVDLAPHEARLTRFYETDFAELGSLYGPRAGARHAVERALALDLKVVIATNPVFPRAAVEQRLAWAGLADLPLPSLTSYEEMTACKPYPSFFRQAAALEGLDPRECLMVGDDRSLDLPAADVGMRTFYVGGDETSAADFSGDLMTLADDLLPRLAAS